MVKKVLVALGVSLAAFAVVQAQQKAPSAKGALTALDYYEIQNLYGRYSHALDSAADAGHMYSDVFTVDGVFTDENGKTFEGREKLAEYARGTESMQKGPTNVAHFTQNILIDPVPGGAIARGYVMVASRDQATGRGAITGGGQYWDVLVKTNAGWRIKKRSFFRSGATPTATLQATAASLLANVAPVTDYKGTGISVEDYQGIFQHYSRYGYAFDGGLRDGKEWADLFTEDGFHVNSTAGEFVKGPLALAEFARGAMRYDNKFVVLVPLQGTSKDPSRVGHILTNFMMVPVAEGVLTKVYRMSGAIGANGQPNSISPGGIYFDLLVKTPAGWRFKEKWYITQNTPVPEGARRFISPTPTTQLALAQ